MEHEDDAPRSPFTLTLKERLLLANQCRILAKLYPDEKDHYEEMHQALTSGYALHYGDLVNFFCDEMTADECREVIHIIDMHRALNDAYQRMVDKGQVKPEEIEFRGFDGNEETKYLNYAKFLMEVQGRWKELHRDDLNTHWPILSRYRKMLEEYERCVQPHHLSTQDLLRIVKQAESVV
ncbi:MAG: YfbU family protein [Bryobacteraceae bacterium]